MSLATKLNHQLDIRGSVIKRQKHRTNIPASGIPVLGIKYHQVFISIPIILIIYTLYNKYIISLCSCHTSQQNVTMTRLFANRTMDESTNNSF